MPTEKPLEIRTHQLFNRGKSFVDVNEVSKFLTITYHEGKVILSVLVDPNTPVTWRKIVAVPAVDHYKLEGIMLLYEYVGNILERDGTCVFYMMAPEKYKSQSDINQQSL